MNSTSRRSFLQQSTTGIALATAIHATPASVRAANPSQRLVLGMIGPGGHGSNLLRSFASQPDVDIAWVCDVDARRLETGAKIVETATGKVPRTDKDMRRVFEDRTVDAVIIATPDHWHAPATLLACQAGKHVYVEKPCAHNLREGRLMVEAARRHQRVVQVGTQSRSAPHLQRAMQLLREGAIGEVLVAKAWNSQLRGNIGKVPPSPPPPHLDFDLWLGPAPEVPYQTNLLPGIWRWRHAFGTGDIGNDGIHEIDIARWGLGVETHPTRIIASGAKCFFDDDQEFPDTQYVVYEYGAPALHRKQLVYEQRIWSPYVQETHENGNAFYGTKGLLVLGKQSGWQLFGPKNQLREKFDARLDSLPHHRDFLDAIRNNRRPNADIEIGHLSAALAHLGNLASRVGRELRFDPATESLDGDPEASRLLRREYRTGHWAVPPGV